MKSFYWLVRRELWEHRGGFLWAPIITGGIFLLLNLMAVITGEVLGVQRKIGADMNFGATVKVDGQNGLDLLISGLDHGQLAQVGAGLDVAMYSATAVMAVVLGFMVLFYCLGALYDERRDRSILFWKSLPVSDTATVLSKVVSATVLAPAITFVTGVITGVLMLLMYAIVLSFHGIGVWQLLTLAHPLRVISNLLGSIPLYFLWALPAVGWLLLCSVWARSKPFLWAVLLPVATGVIVGWFSLMGSIGLSSKWYWTHIFNRLVLSVFPGLWFDSASPVNVDTSRGPEQMLAFLDLGHSYSVLATSNLWIGALAGLAMIAAAVWFRRWRDDS